MIKSSGLIFLLLGFILPVHFTFSQAGVGIGVTVPDSSAVLHVQAPTNNKGLLIPRLTTAEKNTIANPAEGLLVYDTDQNSLYHFNGSWQIIGTPPGGIIMWSGTVPPAGWALCDGSNNTPDLRGKFIVGYNPTDTKFDQPGDKSTGGTITGDIGGLQSVTLTPAQMPSHTHSGTTATAGSHTHSYNDDFSYIDRWWDAQFPGSYLENLEAMGNYSGNGTVDNWSNTFAGRTKTTVASGDHTHTFTTGPAGNDQPVVILPPFYALAFIMKL